MKTMFETVISVSEICHDEIPIHYKQNCIKLKSEKSISHLWNLWYYCFLCEICSGYRGYF